MLARVFSHASLRLYAFLCYLCFVFDIFSLSLDAAISFAEEPTEGLRRRQEVAQILTKSRERTELQMADVKLNDRLLRLKPMNYN